MTLTRPMNAVALIFITAGLALHAFSSDALAAKAATPKPAATQKPSAQKPSAQKPSAQKAASLEISTKGSELAFDKDSLSARAGQTVKLTFHNKAEKASGLQHNWLLVKPGTQGKVAAAGVQAGAAKNYVPDASEVLAHTKLLSPGESETVSFTAPAEPGDYPYFCSYPGHAALLKGVMHVKK